MFANIANLVLWIGLLLAFIFADQIGLSLSFISTPLHLGPTHIASIIFGVIGLIIAVLPFLGRQSE